jgi:hypothetical protein
MKKKRIIIVMLFIVAAVMLFFTGRAIEDYIFIKYAPEDLIGQFKYGFNLRLFMYGFEIILLALLSVSGLQISKRKGAVEYSKGFYFTTMVSGLLFLLYLILLARILFW